MMLEKLLENEKIASLKEALVRGDSILVEETWNPVKAFLASLALTACKKNVLILTGTSLEESRLFHDFPTFLSDSAIEFPAWETLPSEQIAPSPDVVGERYKVLEEIVSKKKTRVILSSLQAALQKLIAPKKFDNLYLTLKKGCSFSFDLFITRLSEMGYQRQPVAADKGDFAVRGGIIDVYPVSSPDPYRIEFWGDDIESIRYYDPIGQKSVGTIDAIDITPAKELEFIREEKNLSTIIDYLGKDTIIVFDDLLSLEDRYSSLVNIIGQSIHTFCSMDEFLQKIKDYQKIFISQELIETLSEVQLIDKKNRNYYSENTPLYELKFQMFNHEFQAYRFSNPFIPVGQFLLDEQENISAQDLLFALSRLSNSDYHLHFLVASELEKSTLQKKIDDASIILPKSTEYINGYLSSGFCIEKEIFFPYTEITHRYKLRRQKQRSTYHITPSENYNLMPGDLVVHLNNGIGKFLGLDKKPNHTGTLSEFFVIEYAENSKLYVPLNQAYLVSKYVGSHDEIPKLHTIGSSRWKKTKESTERAILSYAADLLELYAKRSVKEGFCYPQDSSDMKAFEDDFPFVETEDQINAITDIKNDMQNIKCMDRLVCGDVGYGKTEVAMRAAFKAVVDGKKQVAVMVPTTVLAMQHFENFVERMSNFPINIAVLSRFRSPKQIKESLEGLAKGSVDIVIGTHRVISEDVVFKDLGLIIIDEEQRFGVKTKEHLKKLKVSVECLTLSATPIPRTLYMSLIGARDMSVISTPPQDRLPITTVITEATDATLKNALLRELSRDGQAFVIHNRVETIHAFAERIQKLLPQARIVVGHGQMASDEIDTVFHAFKSGQADILVATTIIESGIDIPNANTILIDRADRFGMSDLYQLRGRVGRWNRRAYAYFMVPKVAALPEISRKRLQALIEAQGFGGGMKIAMRDLEIRGAGNVLGMEQSGHVEAIGFHLYCKLLKRTIQAMQGKIPSVITDTKVDFPVDARLPEDFVNEVSLRMEIYQRLGDAIHLNEVDAIFDEIKDRFGRLPTEALWLYHLTRIRVFAATNGYSLLKMEKVTLYAEKIKGKENMSKRVLVGAFKNPQDMETKVLKALK